MKNKKNDVVILAAGVGSRLRPITDKKPKSMVQVNGVALIERLLHQLKKRSSIDNIFVLTGYMHEKLSGFIKKKYQDVHCIYNPDYSSTNNMYSLSLFLKNRESDNNLIIINGDCIYDDEIIKECVLSEKPCVMMDSSAFSEESMKVKVDGELVEAISKKINKAVNVFTSVDIYRLDNETIKKLTLVVDAYIDSGDLNQWTEVAINDLINKTQSHIYANDIKGHKWFEIDDIEDLNEAKSMFKDED